MLDHLGVLSQLDLLDVESILSSQMSSNYVSSPIRNGSFHTLLSWMDGLPAMPMNRVNSSHYNRVRCQILMPGFWSDTCLINEKYYA